MIRRLLAIVVSFIAALSGVSAQATDVVPDGAGDEAVAAQVLGVNTATWWGGERAMYHYRVYGDGVAAEFFSVDTSTCSSGIETEVFVQGSRGVVYAHEDPGAVYLNGDPVESSIVTVVVNVFDRCLNETVLAVTGNGPLDQLQLNPNLKSANLRASFAGMDESGNPVVIGVDLVWNGAGGRDRTSDHTRLSGVFHFVTNSTGTIREAVAGGSVVVGGLDVTPLPSIQGVIETSATRRLEFYR